MESLDNTPNILKSILFIVNWNECLEMLRIRYEYLIFTVTWRPLTNTFVQASEGMSAPAKLLVNIIRRREKQQKQREPNRAGRIASIAYIEYLVVELG